MSKKHEPTPQYRAMQELRKGSRTSPHDSRPKRQRSRADAKRAAIRQDRGAFSLPRRAQEFTH